MTDRNELERLLAAATEGPFSSTYKNYAVQGNMRAIVNGDRYPIAFVPAWDAPEDGEGEASAEGEANAALICFLRNNAQHYLSLMDEVERLRGELGWAIETLHEINPSNYDHDDVCALNSASVEVILGLQKALGETHDN